MKPFYQDNHIRIFNKDCRDMSELLDESVQCVVTSPPYFGLRKYAGDQDLIWGGDKDCPHQWIDYKTSLLHENRNFQKGTQEEVMEEGRELTHIHKYSNLKAGFCSLCGAWRGGLGLAPMPELYLQHLIEIMQEIRRVLRKDGVCFVNIGDSYWGGKGQSGQPMSAEVQQKRYERGESINQSQHQMEMSTRPQDGKHNILKPKDLCLIPFHVAIEAQRDGWWVRSIIIWSKPNPMPESVTDRPTESHEYILMLTKSGTTQYWTHRDHEGSRTQPKPDYRWIHKDTKEEVNTAPEGWTPKHKMGWDRVNLWKGHDYYWDADAVREASTERPSGNKERKYRRDYGGPEVHIGRQGFSIPYEPNGSGRNLRSVWTFPSTPFPAAHFAVFSEKLPELCIKAATPEVGCCSKCLAPWARVTKPTAEYEKLLGKDWNIQEKDRAEGKIAGHHRKHNAPSVTAQYETLGWRPTCACNAPRVPSLVLDPMMGAGTTLLVAKKLNRYAVGWELSQEYCQLAGERCQQQVML